MNKIFTRLIALLAFSFFSLLALAQNSMVIVKGKLTYANGVGIGGANVQMHIDSASSIGGTCMQTKYVVTNAAGNYIDTLRCNTGTFTNVVVVAIACGTNQTAYRQVGTNGLIEQNFQFACNPPSLTCNAALTVTPNNANNSIVILNSNQSTSNLGDSITNRTYYIVKLNSQQGMGGGSFGGLVVDSIAGNQALYTYQFADTGLFKICVVIKTSSGCVNQTCSGSFSVLPANQPGCLANFNFNANNLTVQFTNSSIAAVGAQYFWNFGDGATSTVANPLYTYAAPGTYLVKLRITVGNCVDTVAKLLMVTAATNNNCVANITATQGGTAFAYSFSSAASTAIMSDSIVARTYTIRRSSNNQLIQTITGNLPTIQWQFADSGLYRICVVINTAQGCQKESCIVIAVIQPIIPVNCNAAFGFQPLSAAGTNGWPVKFNSAASTTGSNDSIMERIWKWGDGTPNTLNNTDPTHVFAQTGTYNVCLIIRSARGCSDTICKTVVVPLPGQQTHCKAAFNFAPVPLNASTNGYGVLFNSNNSYGVGTDSIISRQWIWGDGTVLSGNTINPVKYYLQTGVYNACLVITTLGGCRDTVCVTLNMPLQGQTPCKANFTHTILSGTRAVKYNDASIVVAAGDSIVSRKWELGNGAIITGNQKEIVYTYSQSGLYNVCLTITTARGCSQKICKQVFVPTQIAACISRYTYMRIAPKTVQFNSNASWAPTNDSIIERIWTFGDSTTLGGNIISPVKTYAQFRNYTVCLKIRTAKGCVQTFCGPVRLGTDTANTQVVRIVQMYPVPVSTQLNTVVSSTMPNVQAELSIYDVYGVKKYSINRILMQGANLYSLPTSNLAPGPYFFRVTTIYGIQSRSFYKL
jgi:PKD repeat protein